MKKIPWKDQYSSNEYDFLKNLGVGDVPKRMLPRWAAYEMKRVSSKLEWHANYSTKDHSEFLAMSHMLAQISEELVRYYGEKDDLIMSPRDRGEIIYELSVDK